MGWFWDSTDASKDDPYKKLDPALRDFLDKESPVKYEDTKPKPTRTALAPSSTTPLHDGASNRFRSQLGLGAADVDQHGQPSSASHSQAAVPAQSLYQDGRYAHLWKDYRPQSEVEAAGRSDQDRLAAVVEAYQDRKAAIGRAAVENCVDYQIAEKECFSNGSWKKRLSMCRAEAKDFNRCYTMQARFLKALGYLATQRTEEEEERIQMHADKLYQEMLGRERMAAEAKQQGVEAPHLPPLMQPETTMTALGEDSAWAQARRRAVESGQSNDPNTFSPEKQKEIEKRLEGLSKPEQDLELQLIAAENRAKIEYAEQVREHLEEDRQRRADRRERGKETIGDTVKRLWGWDK